ncbi:hypothetical protein Y88_0362 [Novosphingobium nitrogenifigens DSM 19370]|uniref:Uncharacterized protein n=1 Tax=Novosphingobium nitrogenifigens DSM 19370 TaxID=983920 RepID=F1ZAQ5_9SPHN|nr:carbohydrate porin [Novosphingobium nitrogenifigens]EGD58308.1 hypothetical protein Y88_0362 [Novosphingobium nitrogenifigens DSM 19370]
MTVFRFCLALAVMAPLPAFADEADVPQQDFAIHAQSTLVAQGTPGFSSPYAGTNSLAPNQARETWDATIYAGVRPWQGAELWVNPELDQGFGLSNTLGVAGFPSAEAYKVGKSNPYFKLPRLFLRQTIGLGGGKFAVDAAANQLRGMQDRNRLVITIGKFSVVDVFDTNSYAHDARSDFLNWSLVDAGAFDYAANAWGFTFGGALEWYQGAWTVRAGLFNLSKVPNQPSLETGFGQYQVLGELEHRHSLGGHPGAVRMGFWMTRGRLARLRDLIAAHDATGVMPDNADLRSMHDHWGGYFNAEQEVTPTLGLFARLSASDGVTEADDFTDIDRSASVGGQVKGAAWGRHDDRIGFAGVVNQITRTHQIYLDDGGYGTLVGDGRLPHPGSEWIAEGWYQVHMDRHVDLTLDYQFVANPGYNRDRGPAHVFALRLRGAI